MTRREWIMSGTAFSATLGLVLVLMGILASGDVMSAELTDGRTLRTVSSRSDSSVLLVYDPADAFTCSQALQEWKRVQSSSKFAVVVLLTRPPTSVELRHLALSRVQFEGIVVSSWLRGQLRSRELLVVHGGVRLRSNAPKIGSSSGLHALIDRHAVSVGTSPTAKPISVM